MSLNNLGINININVNAGQSANAANNVAASLNKVATAARRAKPPLDDTYKAFKDITGAFTQIVIAKTIFGVFEGIAERSNAISQGLANIRSVMEESFGPGQEAKLTSTLMNVAEETGKGFKNVADVTKNLIAQGMDPDQAEKMLGPLMKFAMVGEVSAQATSDLALGITNMGLSADQTGMALDIMNNMANKTSLNAQDFAMAMSGVAPIAHQNNQNFTDLVVTLGLLRKGFNSAQIEMTSLRNTFLFLGKPKVQKDVKAAFGVDVLDKSTGKMRKILDIIRDVNDAIAKGHGKQGDLSTIFGGRTGAQVFGAGREVLSGGLQFNGKQRKGQDLIDAAYGVTGQSGGAVEKSFQEKMNTFSEQVNRLKTAFDDLVGVASGSFLKSLTEITRGLADAFTWTRLFIEQHPKFAAGLGFIAEHFTKIALGIGAVLGLSGGFKLLGFAMGIFRTNLGGILGFIGKTGGGGFIGGVIGQIGTLLMMGGKMTGMFGMLARVVGFFWKGLLGPFGLLLMAVEVLPALLHLIFGTKAPETSNKFGESNLESNKSLTNAADALTLAAQAMAQATLEFNQIVAQYTGLLQHKASVFDVSAVGAAGKINQMAQGTNLALPSAVQAANIAAIKSFFDFAMKNPDKTIPESVTSEMVRAAMMEKGIATSLHTKSGDKQAKFMEDLVSNAENITTKGSIQSRKDILTGQEERNVSRIGAPTTNTNFGKVSTVGGVQGVSIIPKGMSPEQLVKQQEAIDRIYGASGFGKNNKQNLNVIIDTPVELKVDGGSVHGMLKAYDHAEAVKAGLEH